MLMLICGLCLVALLERYRRARKLRDEIDRFMEWGEYETIDRQFHPPPIPVTTNKPRPIMPEFPEGECLMHAGQPIDRATHISCVRLAWTLVNRIQCLLRPEEVDECARQFYLDIREHMKQQNNLKEDGSHVHG